MLTVDAIRGGNDWWVVLGWVLIVFGLSKAIFYSQAARWLWAALEPWNFEGQYQQFKWQVARGIERTRAVDEDGQPVVKNRRPVFNDRKLTAAEIEEKLAFIDRKRIAVYAWRFFRVPFWCDFCATAQVALVLLACFGEGSHWVLSTFLYASAGWMLGLLVVGKPKAPEKSEPEGDCPGGSCGGKRATVSMEPAQLIPKTSNPFPREVVEAMAASVNARRRECEKQEMSKV